MYKMNPYDIVQLLTILCLLLVALLIVRLVVSFRAPAGTWLHEKLHERRWVWTEGLFYALIFIGGWFLYGASMMADKNPLPNARLYAGIVMCSVGLLGWPIAKVLESRSNKRTQNTKSAEPPNGVNHNPGS